ncbi:MAG: Nif3-like dinuclear metal center hexameric protein [Clostridia bacterium]|nr:Nif3-like dinuclear metal center hexameric protein [Clostridia bacterium]MBR7160604.1 Nif3-like dinuclear metal center hexameric protein [Clostridia bacterium]
MLRQDLATILDDIFHKSLQLDFDNSGYNVSLGGEVAGVYVTLDATKDAVKKCKDSGCNFLITHHPIIFRPLDNIDDGYVSEIVVEAIRQDVAIYSAHTNVDVMRGGLNDELATLLGLEDIEVLDEVDGGRIGRIEPTTVRQFAKHIKGVIGDEHIKTVLADKTISQILLINGAGGSSSIRAGIDRGVDAVVTCEVKYNMALECLGKGVGVIELGHYESERPFIKLAERIILEAIDTNIKIVTDEDYLTPYDKENI